MKKVIMRGTVYILRSGQGQYYVGSTLDLERRKREHLRGHTPSTRSFKNIGIVFAQEFESLEIARKVERKIKSWKRRDFIEKVIKDGRIKFMGR